MRKRKVNLHDTARVRARIRATRAEDLRLKLPPDVRKTCRRLRYFDALIVFLAWFVLALAIWGPK